MVGVWRPIMTTREAANYCGLTMSGLRHAYLRGRVRPAGRRGGASAKPSALLPIMEALKSPDLE